MNHPELLSKLTAFQSVLWPSVVDRFVEATGKVVQINSPLVVETSLDDMRQEFDASCVVVAFAFAGQPGSVQQFILPVETAGAILQSFVEGIEELDESTIEHLQAPMEALVQGVCLAIGNARSEVVVPSDFSVRLGPFPALASMQASEPLYRVQSALGVEATIGSLTWLIDARTAEFVANLDASGEPQAAFFNSMPPFGASRGSAEVTHGLDILMDVPLDISVELGRTRMMVKEIVDLGVGSIVEIEKAAGEPVDILVNGRIVARGEVVVIEDNFGVRITEILNPRERLARLNAAA